MTESTTVGKRSDFLSGQPVDGEILAVKLHREMLAPEEALQYALDIGRALSRAHVQGMVHGKVSPANIMIADGVAVLLKGVPGEDLDLGYRAPEQVKKQPADERTDIFSFGVLLYELASGEAPFQGEGIELNNAILKDQPPPIESPLTIHQAMSRVMESCLAKDPGKRRQRIKNALTELRLNARTIGKGEASIERRALPAPAGAAAIPSPRRSSSFNLGGAPLGAAAKQARATVRPFYARTIYQAPKKGLGLRVWIIISGALLLCVASVAAVMLLPGRSSAPVYRFSVDQEEGKYPGMPAVSPDGRSLSWSAAGPEGKRMLWVQALDGAHAKPVANTEGAAAPFWSPDSSYIGFFANDYLKKIAIIDGNPSGAPANICKVDSFSGGGAWSKDGTILFAASLTGGLSRVPAAGGAPQPVTRLNAAKNERAHLWPQFLPDGKHFIFFVATDASTDTGAYSGSLDLPNHSLLFSSETNAVYSNGTGASGYLLFIRNSSLMGQPFLASKLTVSGDALTLATNMEPVENLSLAQISVSDNGTLVYQSAGTIDAPAFVGRSRGQACGQPRRTRGLGSAARLARRQACSGRQKRPQERTSRGMGIELLRRRGVPVDAHDARRSGATRVVARRLANRILKRRAGRVRYLHAARDRRGKGRGGLSQSASEDRGRLGPRWAYDPIR